MKSISYAGETVYTSDEVASAVVELCAALARRSLAEAVTIPICDDGGTPSTAELVIGIGSDVLAMPFPFDGREPDCDADAAALRTKIDVLVAPRAVAVAVAELDPSIVDEFYDLV